MAAKRHLKLSCPTCKKSVPMRTEDFPFCSERCRLIDLGKWASGTYRIPSSLPDTDEGPSNNLSTIPDDDF